MTPHATAAAPARPAAGGMRAVGTVLLALGLPALAFGGLIVLVSLSDRRPPAPGEYGTGSSNWGWVLGLVLAAPGALLVVAGLLARSRSAVARRVGAAILAGLALLWAVRAFAAPPRPALGPHAARPAATPSHLVA